MNTTAIIIALKNRSLTKTQRKSLYAWAKYMIEESYGTSESLIWFNIYCELNKSIYVRTGQIYGNNIRKQYKKNKTQLLLICTEYK